MSQKKTERQLQQEFERSMSSLSQEDQIYPGNDDRQSLDELMTEEDDNYDSSSNWDAQGCKR